LVLIEPTPLPIALPQAEGSDPAVSLDHAPR
jgi:hypothetical protein